MEKFILAETNEEVNLGDCIECTGKKEYEDGFCLYKETFILTEKSLQKLIDKGVVIVKVVPEEDPLNVDKVIEHLAARVSFKLKDLYDLLYQFSKVNETAVFSTLLKECALILDEKYPDHISDSKQIFVVSTLDGKITEIPKACIKSFKNFAAFRTLEDARTACRVLKFIIRKLFNGTKQKG